MSWAGDNWLVLSLIGLYGLEQIAKKTKTKVDDKIVGFARGAIQSVTGGVSKATTGAYKAVTGTFKTINGNKNGSVK